MAVIDLHTVQVCQGNGVFYVYDGKRYSIDAMFLHVNYPKLDCRDLYVCSLDSDISTHKENNGQYGSV